MLKWIRYTCHVHGQGIYPISVRLSEHHLSRTRKEDHFRWLLLSSDPKIQTRHSNTTPQRNRRRNQRGSQCKYDFYLRWKIKIRRDSKMKNISNYWKNNKNNYTKKPNKRITNISSRKEKIKTERHWICNLNKKKKIHNDYYKIK